MLNRRILRIKVFKTLYGSELKGNSSLAEAEAQLESSCEATRDLYLFMLGAVSPLTAIAAEKISAARNKFNPTEEERNPNTKFADNALAGILDEDPDFQKIYKKKKFTWEPYDLFLRKVYASITSSKYYSHYNIKQDICFHKLWDTFYLQSCNQHHTVNADMEQKKLCQTRQRNSDRCTGEQTSQRGTEKKASPCAPAFQDMVKGQEDQAVHHEIFQKKHIYVQLIIHPPPSSPGNQSGYHYISLNR